MNKISLQIEIDLEAYEALQSYLNTHSTWDQDRVFDAGLSLFLMQNGGGSKALSEIYLESLFGRPEVAA